MKNINQTINGIPYEYGIRRGDVYCDKAACFIQDCGFDYENI